jgi:hypothetical protein
MNGIAPIHVDPRILERAQAVTEPEVPGASVFRRGKVRTVFHAGPEQFVIVATIGIRLGAAHADPRQGCVPVADLGVLDALARVGRAASPAERRPRHVPGAVS